MPKYVHPPTELTHAVNLLAKERKLTELSKRSKVSLNGVQSIRDGTRTTPDVIRKVARALAVEVPASLPIPTAPIQVVPAPVNGTHHLEAYLGALMEGMDFMRLQVLRYLNNGSAV